VLHCDGGGDIDGGKGKLLKIETVHRIVVYCVNFTCVLELLLLDVLLEIMLV